MIAISKNSAINRSFPLKIPSNVINSMSGVTAEEAHGNICLVYDIKIWKKVFPHI